MTSDGQNGWCGACLSRGRRLTPLASGPAEYVLRAAAEQLSGCERDVATPLRVCWECRAAADRMIVFCERVHRAQTLLSSISHNKLIDANQFTTMSTLGIMTKIGYDFEFNCLGLFPNETISQRVKKDRDKSHQVSRSHSTWELTLSPIVDFQKETCTVAVSNSSETTKVTQPKEGCFVIMNDMTKKRNNIKDICRSEAETVTVKKIKGSRTVEMKLSDLKVEKAKRQLKKIRKNIQPKKHFDESNVAIKLIPAEYIPSQRPGKITTLLMSEQEMLAAREEERRAPSYAGSPYKCDTCILGFLNAALLREHDLTTHSPEVGAHLCDICASRFPCALAAANHRRAHRQLYACARCGYARRRLAEARAHAEAAHGAGRAHACRTCGQLFMKLRQLKYHRETKHRARRVCPHCNSTFASGTSFSQHLKLHAGLPLYECAHCQKSYRGKAALTTHMRTHARGGDDAYCAECDAQFKSNAIYRAHLRTSLKHVRPEDLKYRCDACDKGFMLPRELRLHYDFVHLRTDTYKCHACDKSFINPRNLKRHKLTAHEGVRPVKNKVCTVCDKAFINKKDLMQHQDIHTGARPYSCDMCDSTFRQTAALYTHRRLVHHKIKKTAKSNVP